MKRQVSIEEISDGRLYGLNDMVKADCHSCQGCSACCQGMGDSVLLDPMDVMRLTVHLHVSFETLLEEALDLNLADGIILPNLRMCGDSERCVYLNEQGRCSIHAFRPGVCRLFPLGRYYEEQGFRYFLQIHECPNPNKTKVKVRKWIDTEDPRQYELFILDWHKLLSDMERLAASMKLEEVKAMNLQLLRLFYQTPFSEEDFYIQFAERLLQMRQQFFDSLPYEDRIDGKHIDREGGERAEETL